MNEQPPLKLSGFGKIPSGLTIASLFAIVATGIWNGAKLQDQITANTQASTLYQVRIDALQKIIDTGERRIDALSFRMDAEDGRTNSLTNSLTTLAAEISGFKDQQEAFNRQLATNVAEVRALLQERLDRRVDPLPPPR